MAELWLSSVTVAGLTPRATFGNAIRFGLFCSFICGSIWPQSRLSRLFVRFEVSLTERNRYSYARFNASYGEGGPGFLARLERVEWESHKPRLQVCPKLRDACKALDIPGATVHLPRNLRPRAASLDPTPGFGLASSNCSPKCTTRLKCSPARCQRPDGCARRSRQESSAYDAGWRARRVSRVPVQSGPRGIVPTRR